MNSTKLQCWNVWPRFLIEPTRFVCKIIIYSDANNNPSNHLRSKVDSFVVYVECCTTNVAGRLVPNYTPWSRHMARTQNVQESFRGGGRIFEDVASDLECDILKPNHQTDRSFCRPLWFQMENNAIQHFLSSFGHILINQVRGKRRRVGPPVLPLELDLFFMVLNSSSPRLDNIANCLGFCASFNSIHNILFL